MYKLNFYQVINTSKSVQFGKVFNLEIKKWSLQIKYFFKQKVALEAKSIF